ncbi:hypothetical protein CERSUDRAFT_119775, partial [Gelatoporia subvermispora B]
MDAPKPAVLPTTAQPQAVQMNMMNPPQRSTQQEHQHGKASRIRGGGAAKDCFLGAIECFVCFGASNSLVRFNGTRSNDGLGRVLQGLLRVLRRHHLLTYVRRLPVRDVLLDSPHSTQCIPAWTRTTEPPLHCTCKTLSSDCGHHTVYMLHSSYQLWIVVLT